MANKLTEFWKSLHLKNHQIRFLGGLTSNSYENASNKTSYSKKVPLDDGTWTTLPSVGNGHVDFLVNNVPVGGFDANQSKDGFINITVPTVPTKLSAFTNDKYFVPIHVGTDVSSSTTTLTLPSSSDTFVVGEFYFNTSTRDVLRVRTVNSTQVEFSYLGKLQTKEYLDSASLYAGTTQTKVNDAITSPYIKLFNDDDFNSQVRILGANGLTVKSNASGTITVYGTLMEAKQEQTVMMQNNADVGNFLSETVTKLKNASIDITKISTISMAFDGTVSLLSCITSNIANFSSFYPGQIVCVTFPTLVPTFELTQAGVTKTYNHVLGFTMCRSGERMVVTGVA